MQMTDRDWSLYIQSQRWNKTTHDDYMLPNLNKMETSQKHYSLEMFLSDQNEMENLVRELTNIIILFTKLQIILICSLVGKDSWTQNSAI